MATTNKEFLIRVRADITRAVAQMQDLSGKLEQTAKSGQQASRNTRVLSSDLGGLVRAAVGAAAALGAIKIARDVVQAVDTYKLIEGRLKLVTENTQELTLAQAELFNIAQRTRVTYDSTGDLYTRLARATQRLGTSQDELLTATETVNQALIIGGGAADSNAAAIIQVGQALQSGTLQGEELRSVLEQAPRLAQAIADGLGVAVGDLKKLGEAGELTSEKVFRALLKQREKIEQEFAQIPRTVGQALTQLRNDLQRAFSGTETQPLIEAIDDFRDKISDPEIVTSIVAITNAMLTLAGVAGEVVIKIAEIGQGLAIVAGPLINPTDLERLEQLKNELAHKQDRLSLEDGKVLPFFSNRLKAQIAELEREIEALRARLKPIQVLATPDEIKAANDAAAKPDSTGTTTPPGAPDPDAAAREKAREASEKYVQALEAEAATYGLTRVEQARYELGLREMEPALRKRAEAALDAIQAQERATEIEKASADAIAETVGWIEEVNEAERERKRSLHEQAEALRDQLQPSRLLIREIERFDELLKAGEITIEEYRAALQKLGTDASDVADETGEIGDASRRLEEAGEDLGFTFQSAFEDAIIEGAKFRDILDGIYKDILRIAVRKAITENIATGVSGLFVNSDVAHEGGIAGAGLPTRSVSPLVFAGAPHYHLGGFAGLKPNEVPAILEAGEEILPRDHPRHRANAGERSGKEAPGDNVQVIQDAILASDKFRDLIFHGTRDSGLGTRKTVGRNGLQVPPRRLLDGIVRQQGELGDARRLAPAGENLPSTPPARDYDRGIGGPRSTFQTAFQDAIIQGAIIQGATPRDGLDEPAARGNLFDPGDRIPFGRGGVVHEPVFFPLAKGTGLMGEAGPEGILPLKRTRGGDLGVSAEGIGSGAIDRVIINNYGAEPARTEQQRNNGGGIDLVVTIGQAVAQDIGNNGPAARAMQGAFGLRRSLTRR